MSSGSSQPVTRLLADAPILVRQKRGRLLIIDGPDKGESVEVKPKSSVTFGSSSSCTLALSDKTVSRQHLEAEWTSQGLLLRDLGSTNGSFFQGSRIKEITIGYGAEFKLGRTVVKFIPGEEAVKAPAGQTPSYGSLVAQDPKMRELFSLLDDVAKTDATVVIEGETGTGKELVAEEIHKHSNRSKGPFVVFDCGAVPRDLIESSLFGHVKGAFTGAATDRKGAFAAANGGTIFLDELGELDIDLQPALLRVLDKRAVQRVGDSSYQRVDVRVIAATNRDLREEVAKRRFREDLYYRLAVIKITLPALRERGSDIPYLAEHFVKSFTPDGRVLSVTAEDMKTLQQHSWPGNVRELRNVIERSCVLARGDRINLDAALVDDDKPDAGIRTDLPFKEAKGKLVERFERAYILDLMKRHNMNVSAAAREAQIDRKHLRELIRKYDLGDKPDQKDD